MITPLSINLIRTDGGTQPRSTLDHVVIQEYANAMIEGGVFPPVVAFYDEKVYWLADGFHRVAGAREAGLPTIEAEVRQGTQHDAQWFSYSVNQRHGLRRTNADKQRAAKAALQHPKAVNLSDGQIAEHCGVSRAMVQNYRPSCKDGKIKNAVRTVTRGGITYQQDTSNIGKKRKVARESLGPAAVTESAITRQNKAAAMKNAKRRAEVLHGCRFTVGQTEVVLGIVQQVVRETTATDASQRNSPQELAENMLCEVESPALDLLSEATECLVAVVDFLRE